jgi:tetratricopeptide (TPR) repeat protein
VAVAKKNGTKISGTIPALFELLGCRRSGANPRDARKRTPLARSGHACHDEAVTTVAADTALARGYEALAVGNWSEARTAFEEAVRTAESPEALDGLGRSLWWLRQGREAIVCRERAYSGFRRDGELARAARIALWLSREYALVFGNDAAARGWLARAERLLRDVAPGAPSKVGSTWRARKARTSPHKRRHLQRRRLMPH